LLLPVIVRSENLEFKYNFEWAFITVASLSLNLNESIYASSDTYTKDHQFTLSTKGPLKLYRKYNAGGFVKQNENGNKYSWNYYLQGYDRGMPEEKLIMYTENGTPHIITFIDDKGALPLTVDNYIDKNVIDPFSIILEMINQLNKENDCSNNFLIFDGKRRYRANIEYINDKFKSQNKSHHCRISIYDDMTSPSNKINIWPFNGTDKIIDIWFSGESLIKPVRLEIDTPIGKIIGKLSEN
tara:strand:- start:784 stop:1506 length:723 start_codon:yes stop_codon:yes gene_type:complete